MTSKIRVKKWLWLYHKKHKGKYNCYYCWK